MGKDDGRRRRYISEVCECNSVVILSSSTSVQARWLGVIVMLLVVFSFPFPLGIFALAGCGVAWWFVRDGRYRLTSVGRRRSRTRWRLPEERRTLNPVRWFHRWRLRRRFMRLMKQADLGERDS